MNRDEIIEQSAQVLSTYTTCDGRPYATELHRRQAHALADAGLLARPLPTRDEIAMAMYEVLDPQYGDFCTPHDAADAVLELLKGKKK